MVHRLVTKLNKCFIFRVCVDRTLLTVTGSITLTAVLFLLLNIHLASKSRLLVQWPIIRDCKVSLQI